MADFWPGAVEQPASPPRRLEYHVKVLALADVRYVDDPVGLLAAEAVLERRHVGGCVAKPAVRLLDDQRHLHGEDAGMPGGAHVCEGLTLGKGTRCWSTGNGVGGGFRPT
eukprot:306146-Chlamydomonas_euryale.AAC.1